MRIIRPAAKRNTTRSLVLALGMILTGAMALGLAVAAGGTRAGVVGTLGVVAALGIGIGSAWLARIAALRRPRSATKVLERLLAPVFDDSYALVLGPRLPIRDGARLDGLLIGPAGVRALTVRDWEGTYRVRGRVWEFDAGRRRGWIRCRTNPSHDVAALAEGVGRWAADTGLTGITVHGAVAFPLARSRVVLEEPADEIVTADNGPWWANAIGRAMRLDPAVGAVLLNAVLDASELAEDTPRQQRAPRQTA